MRTRSSVAASWGIAITALAVGHGPPTVGARELHVDMGASRVARFSSRTQLDAFEGATARIDGYVLLRGGTLSSAAGDDGAEMYFEVDLASLTTGIGLRDRHMRDNYLEVKKYPYASFRGRVVHVDSRADGATQVTATGTFTVHGVSTEREIACDLVSAGGSYGAKCAFEVRLADHGIEIPRIMFLKVAAEIHVDVAFTVSTPESPPRESLAPERVGRHASR
jgi:polyisoprenoid-binding protein YceI